MYLLNTLPNQDGHVTSKEHVEKSLLNVVDFHAKAFAHNHIERTSHFLVKRLLKREKRKVLFTQSRV